MTITVYGYTNQPDDSIAAVNDNKIAEEQLLRALDEMASRPGDFDPRWTALARTHIEIGFMAMNRAVFKPQRVKLPEDK